MEAVPAEQDSRIPTPLWLTDTDYPAPCQCGEGFMHGERIVMVESPTGLKRLMHLRCAPGMGMPDLDDDET